MTLASNIQTGEMLATAAAPLLPPNAQIAIALAIAALNAVQAAQNNGTDVSDAELQALFDQFEVNKKADLAAQKAAGG